MWVRARAFWLPKAGNTLEDYEDAFWPARAVDQEVAGFRFAVADGATETSFAGLWASMLVRAWCRGQLGRHRVLASLPALQHAWLTQVRSRPLPWYAEEKLRYGAFSSILGLTLGGKRQGETRWEALAVGDSCLVQVRDGALLAAFPLAESEAFNSRPALLSSNPVGNASLLSHIRQAEGTWQVGDTFYLMTDALACWFLRSVEIGEDPCQVLGAMQERDNTAFSCLVDELRERRAVRNDDVTLLTITVSECRDQQNAVQ